MVQGFRRCMGSLSAGISLEHLRFELLPGFHHLRANSKKLVVPVVYTGDWESGVTYTQGRDNEFFGATDKLIEAWEQLKAEMLQKYPR